MSERTIIECDGCGYEGDDRLDFVRIALVTGDPGGHLCVRRCLPEAVRGPALKLAEEYRKRSSR